VAIAMLGCLIVVGRGDPFALLRGEVGLGELLIIGCVIGWTIYTLIGRRAGGTLSPLVMTFYASVAGGALLIATGIITGPLRQWPQLSWQGWLSLLYLGVLGSGFSYVWYAHGVVRLGATRAAAFINFVPISALVFGVLLLGEHVGLAVLAGGVLVLGGVWLTNRPTTKKELR
jgi:drug/metabolite transporter (DMT)-like permease